MIQRGPCARRQYPVCLVELAHEPGPTEVASLLGHCGGQIDHGTLHNGARREIRSGNGATWLYSRNMERTRFAVDQSIGSTARGATIQRISLPKSPPSSSAAQLVINPIVGAYSTRWEALGKRREPETEPARPARCQQRPGRGAATHCGRICRRDAPAPHGRHRRPD